MEIADSWRRLGINVAIDFTERKIGDQVKSAEKNKIPYLLVLGEDEVLAKKYKIKVLDTGIEQTLETGSEGLAINWIRNKA